MALIAHKGAVDLLLRILETKSARMAGGIMLASFGEAARVLLASDILTKVGQSNVAAAMDDYEDEPTRVEWSPERESHGYYSSSGKWVAVPEEELNLYGVKMPAFLTQLLVRCDRVTSPAQDPLVADILWDLGTVIPSGLRRAASQCPSGLRASYLMKGTAAKLKPSRQIGRLPIGV